MKKPEEKRSSMQALEIEKARDLVDESDDGDDDDEGGKGGEEEEGNDGDSVSVCC
jgi:hypothetical protein